MTALLVVMAVLAGLALPAAADAAPRAAPSVVGGHDAAAADWPSIAFMLAAWDVDGDGELDEAAGCTGTVVKPRWVLTAAHCVKRPDGGPIDAMAAITGAADFTDPAAEVIRADALLPHPSWDPLRLTGDVMLVRLVAPSSRPPMPLARPGAAYAGDPAVENAAGWGNTDEASEIGTDVLQEAYLQIADDATCARFARRFDRRTQTCAGTHGLAGVCHGDSGGPLTVLDGAGVPHLWGLTSYGPQGDHPGMLPCDLRSPAVFTRVPAFADWVEAQTAAPPPPPPPVNVPPPPPPRPSAPVDRTAPSLRAVRLSRRSFRAARKGPTIARRAGARLSFRLSEPAAVRLTVLDGRRARSPSATIAARSGRTARTFTGKLGSKALAPGRYRLRLSAVDVAGNRSRPASVAFRVVR